MSCSSKRNIAAGSCISTFVSSTYSRRCAPPAWPSSVSAGFAEGFEDFLGMTCNLYLAPLAAQNTRTIDQERAAFDPHELAAVQGFFTDHIEQPAQLFVGIAQQME